MWVEGGVGMFANEVGARSETRAVAEAEPPTGGIPSAAGARVRRSLFSISFFNTIVSGDIFFLLKKSIQNDVSTIMFLVYKKPKPLKLPPFSCPLLLVA
jgi:hypothetical protein